VNPQTAAQIRSYTSGRSGESGFKIESETFNRIVDRANRGFMPTDQEITAFGSGRITKFLVTKLFNQVDAKGETFLTKIVDIAFRNPTHENMIKAKKIYDLGARLSDKAKSELRSLLAKELSPEIKKMAANYFNTPLQDLLNFARILDLSYYIGFDIADEIDMERVRQFVKIPDLSSQIAAKSINQLKALSKKALYDLLSQDPSFEPWWITGKTEVRYLFFSHTTPTLLEAACFVKDLPQQSTNYQQQQNNEQQQQYQQQGEAYFRQQYEELQRQHQRQREQEEYNRQQYEQQRERYRKQQEQKQKDQYAEQQWREQREQQEKYNRQQEQREQRYEEYQRQRQQQQDNNQRQGNRYGQVLTDAQKIQNLKDALRKAMPALSPNASAQMIRTTFLRYMVRNHPDTIRNNKSLSSAERKRRLDELESITDIYNDAKVALDKAIRAARKKP